MSGQGTVIKRFGSEALFEDESRQVHRAKVRRKLSHLVVGDRISYQKSGDEFIISAIQPRRNLLTRQYFRGKARSIAANIDQILIITAPLPRADWTLVDNLLVTVRLMPARATLVRNKSDHPDTPEDIGILREYEALGYPVIHTSARQPDSLPPLAERLKDGLSVMIGQSGVGKTTLANQLIPDLDAPTREISENAELGQHTTSAATLYTLPGGGRIIDSPGIRDFTPTPLEKQEYQHGFVEFDHWLGQCQFHNCLHRQEPGCAIKQAVENGKISQRRYQSYLALVEPGD
ncbi:MAG TPA: ribosome small subunit-dependent GTPase A [Gammaproteobacteria bacterium]|nr:ribosome small subunit-dependent GTPase A [Gammaproteobacteria bacterium]